MNLKVLGTVGVLIWAKKAAKLMTLKEQLDALREHGKFRMSQAIYERALREAGEL
jgi:predicted nucleic acid-binding protein